MPFDPAKMIRRLFAIFVLIGAAWVSHERPAAAAELTVGARERLLVVAPHPDDETLGAGGLVQRVLERGGAVRVVLVTAGDGYVEAVVHDTGQPKPRPAQYIAYGERRLREARAAMRELGTDKVRLQLLGFPDGGLTPLLNADWQRTHPERSRTTGASDSPYREAVDPDVGYDGADLRRELLRLLREAQPTIVVLPHPLDRHPDHRATGIFTLLAIDEWIGHRATPRIAAPELLAYLVHWPDWPPGWNAATPVPESSRATLELPQDFPALKSHFTALVLTDEEIATKRAALGAYQSQQEEMASLLAAFVRRTEPFVRLTSTDVGEVGHLIGAANRTRKDVRRTEGHGAPVP
jgi:LmbE family N-acetylglucosaminyl deacetylase